MLARKEWIEASKFHDLTEAEVLKEVARRVSEHRKQQPSQHPVVLLDLDSTLYEVGPRTHQILLEWAASAEAKNFPSIQSAVAQHTLDQVGYSLRDTFTAMGLDLESSELKTAWESAKKFWDARFFTSEYLKYDHPYDGAAEFAHELLEQGAELIYLTGRDEPGMGNGTRQRLKDDGFPWDHARTSLMLKKAAHLDDMGHKQDALRAIQSRGTLIASFENEPKNLSALYEICPEAMHVFVDTVYSDHVSPPRKGLYRIKGFR